MSFGNYIKENALSFLGYTALLAGGASIVYTLTKLAEPPSTPSIITSLTTNQPARGLTSTRQLKRVVENLAAQCIILLREVVWSSTTDIPRCYLVWRGKPRTIYQYTILAPGLEPISGIYDDTNDNVYYKQPLPILFEKGVTYNVKIKDATSLHSTEANILVNLIEAQSGGAKLEYYEDIRVLELKFKMNLLPNGFVPKGVNVSIKIGDEEQFSLEPSDFQIAASADGYDFHMQKNVGKLNVVTDAIRLEILLFSGGTVCSSYTIELRPSST